MRFTFDPERIVKTEFQDVLLPVQNLKNIKTLNYDPLDHYVYIIDGKSIKRFEIGGKNGGDHSNLEMVLHGHNIQPIDLVIDPYARILFWTCNITNSINVTRIIGKPISIDSVHRTVYDRPRLLAYHLRTK